MLANRFSELTMLTRLRRDYPVELVAAAVELNQLRVRAKAKFERADDMVFTREALEIASGEIIASYRAKRFRDFPIVGDLGCGIGGDSIGFSNLGCRVQAIDLDPVRLAMTQWNTGVYGYKSINTHQLDLRTDPLPEMQAAFADPARRSDGKRHLDIRDYQPSPLELIRRFPSDFPLAFKLAPGISRDDLAELSGEAEFVEVNGELKECMVWLGPLQTSPRRATRLPTGDTLAGEPVPVDEARTIGQYLYDPCPAVVRADLVGLLAEQCGLSPIDPGISVLTSDDLVHTPFATNYRVDDVIGMDRRKLGVYLKERKVGRVTLVKSGIEHFDDNLIAGLKLSGDEHRVLFATTQLGKPSLAVAVRLPLVC